MIEKKNELKLGQSQGVFGLGLLAGCIVFGGGPSIKTVGSASLSSFHGPKEGIKADWGVRPDTTDHTSVRSRKEQFGKKGRDDGRGLCREGESA